MRQSETARVSVIVACRNEIKYIHNFLACFNRQILGSTKIEVCVADGMSDDGTRQILDQHQQTALAFHVIDNPAKIVSTGLNAAIRVARGEIIIRMDVHTEYAPDYISRCLQVLNQTHADNVGGPAQTRADGYIGRSIALAFHTRFTCGGASFHNPNYEGYVDTVPYGCWRKSTLERLGLFDESLSRNQDDELNLRLISSGGKIWQSPKIASWYRPRANLTALFRQYFQYGFWKMSVIRKHGKPASWRHLIPAACIVTGFGLLMGVAGTTLSGSAWCKAAFVDACAGLAALYLALSLGSAVFTARSHGWHFLPILPVVFATYHLSYGLGFVLGLAYRPPIGNPRSHVQQVIAAITR